MFAMLGINNVRFSGIPGLVGVLKELFRCSIQSSTAEQAQDTFSSALPGLKSLFHDFSIPVTLFNQEKQYQEALKAKRPMVAIFDEFGDLVPSNRLVGFHGDAVEDLITEDNNQSPFVLRYSAELPNPNKPASNMLDSETDPSLSRMFFAGILENSMRDILRRIKNDNAPIRALNLSNVRPNSFVKIEVLRSVMKESGLDLPLKEDGSNLKDYQLQIRKFLLESPNYFSKLFSESSLIVADYSALGVNPFAEQIKLIEELEENGCNVYLTAGNDGIGGVNLLSFANGVTVTGATQNGRIAEYSSETSLVNRHEDGQMIVKYIIDQANNEVSFDSQADGNIESTVPYTIFGGPKLADNEDSKRFIFKLLQFNDLTNLIQKINSVSYNNLTDEESSLSLHFDDIYKKDQLIKLIEGADAPRSRKASLIQFIQESSQNNYIYFRDPRAKIEEQNSKLIITTEWKGTSFASPRQLVKEEFGSE